MKIVQSYWSVPSRSTDVQDGRFKGGWLSEKYHYMSIALSCLRLREYYSDVELVTDDYGKFILIDALKLPYTSVDVSLNQFAQYQASLWAISKIQAYRQQQQPFLHVDNDVYIWQPFDDAFCTAPLAAQSLETNSMAYREALQHVFETFPHIPAYFELADSLGDPKDPDGSRVVAVNAGVFGGTDLAFIQEYCADALNFIHHNLAAIETSNKAGLLNLIFEQYLFYKLTCQQQRPVATLFEELGPRFFNKLYEIDKVPFQNTYIHLLGHSKRNPAACEQVEFRLKHEFPVYHQRVLDYLATRPEYVDESLAVLVKPFIVASPNSERPAAPAGMAGLFARTNRFLQHFRPGPAPGTRLALEAAVADVQPQLNGAERAFLHTLFQLDSLGADLLATQFDPQTKFNNISRAYQALTGLDTDGVLAHPLLASHHIRVLPSAWSLTELNAASPEAARTPPLASKAFLLLELMPETVAEQELEAWPKMLYYFQDEPITGNNLLHELCANTDVLDTNSSELVKANVLDFLTMNLVYDGYLVFA